MATRNGTAYLDGVRGLMALCVYLAHHMVLYYDALDHAKGKVILGWGYNGEYRLVNFPFLRILFSGGGAAVSVFFVLSGYVLSKSALRRMREGRTSDMHEYLASSTFRRVIRLYVPPAIVSFIYALVLHLPFGIASNVTWPLPQTNVLQEIRSWFNEFLSITYPLQTNAVYNAWFPYNPPIWTIQSEFRGSIVVYTTLLGLSHATPRWRHILLAAIGLYCLLQYEWQIFCFYGGILLAAVDVYRLDIPFLTRRSGIIRGLLVHAIFFFGWYLLCEPAGVRHGHEMSVNTPGWRILTEAMPMRYFLDEYWRWWNSWGAIMAVYGIMRITWLQRFFNTRKMQYLGHVSYMFYLTHMPLLFLVGERLKRMVGCHDGTPSWWNDRLVVPDIGPIGFSTRWLAMQTMMLLINLLVADYTTDWLDKRSIAWGHAAWNRLKS
ncbi:hypothetical protein PYCC9005_003940 [Savitreella phatthalungensis]